MMKSKTPSSIAATTPFELEPSHRHAAEDRFVALVRQERMRAFAGSLIDVREDELRAAFALALLAIRETLGETARESSARARADGITPTRSARAHAEIEALRLLSMQLVEIGEAAPDETPALRPRKRSIGH